MKLALVRIPYLFNITAEKQSCERAIGRYSVKSTAVFHVTIFAAWSFKSYFRSHIIVISSENILKP